MQLFSLIYLLPALILLFLLINTGKWHIRAPISKVTRRFSSKMFTFGLFVFGASFLNIASKTVDSFMIIGLKGLEQTAIFLIASYLVTLMDLPARSLNAIATPIISESWKNKDYQNIRQIYQKSSVTLLIAGLLVYLLVLLNIHNLTSFLGKDYAEVPMVVLIMGLAKLIDLGTGVNGQIITTSTNWRFDFFTNVLLTLIAFPLNFFLIKQFGIIGAAYSNLIAIFVYNVVRFSFIYKKYGWQPYSFAHIRILITGIVVYFIVKNIPAMPNIYVDSIVRTGLILLLFLPAIRWMNISEEINKMMKFKS
jgi:hypothetical protein